MAPVPQLIVIERHNKGERPFAYVMPTGAPPIFIFARGVFGIGGGVD